MAADVDRHARRLQKMAQRTAKEVLAGLYVAGQEIEIYAEHSITEGSISGAGHIPSLPGQPPNADTRLLDGSIETTIVARGDNPVVHVTANAPYAAFLEFGTSKMAERPFMRPAAKAKEKRVAELVKNATARVIRG